MMKTFWKRTLAVWLAAVLLVASAPAAGIISLGMTASATEFQVGDLVQIGTYPQTRVTDEELIAALDAQSAAWQSYGYYSGTYKSAYPDSNGCMTASNYMQYADVTYAGDRYRGVKFVQYRPTLTGLVTTAARSCQDENGYFIDTTYWFEWEPLLWRVLDPASGLVMTESVIDSQPFHNYRKTDGQDYYGYDAHWGDPDRGHYANNYACSDIRAWLTDELDADSFLNTAFTAAQREKITAAALDNSAYRREVSDYGCEATTDKVFLLSWSDVTTKAYGFSVNNAAEYHARLGQGTDYAKCQGLLVNTTSGYSQWLLRTAGDSSKNVCNVTNAGACDVYCVTESTNYGIRPAMHVDLDYAYATAEYTAKFVADGKTVGKVKYTADTTSIQDKEPAVPAKEGYDGAWPTYTLLVGGVTVEAEYTPIPDDITWSFDTETGVLTISGTGTMADYAYNSSPWVSYRSSVKAVTIDSGVTTIGKYAFYGCTIPDRVTSISSSAFSGCTGLTSVTIPDSVSSIGGSAFRNCTSLTSVTIPDSVTGIGSSAFYGVGNIVYSGSATGSPWGAKHVNKYAEGYFVFDSAEKKTLLCCSRAVQESVIIPDSVTTIGDYAFRGCTGLTSVTIPNSVTSIGDEAFSGCTGLTSVTIPDSVTTIGDYAFSGCTGLTSVTIGNSVTRIDSFAFWGCTSLASVTIPDSVTIIGSYAFSGCTGLTSVTIPDSVTTIGDYAFSGCTGLTNVTIPDSVTSIGSGAFENCTSLTSATIPDSVTTIGDYAFRGCTSLTSVTIPGNVTSIGSCAFENCTGLTCVTIPDSVTTIGGSAFRNCTSLTSVTIPDSVTGIGDYAFSGCTGISTFAVSVGNTCYTNDEAGVLYNKDKTVLVAYPCGNPRSSFSIPDSVTHIGSYAFSGCTGLTGVTIPDSMTSISSYAFKGCTSLTSVTIPNGVTGIGSFAFEGCTSLASVTIPNGVTGIGSFAFEGCTSLASVTIPDSVTIIGSSAFRGCTSLTSVTIGNSVTRIDSFAFEGCTSLASVTRSRTG